MIDREKQASERGEPADLITRRDVLAGATAVGISALLAPAAAMGDTGFEGAGSAISVSRTTLARTFLQPPIQYAPVDNWWWEAGHLERDKLALQLQEMKDRGIGGSWFYVRWLYGESLSSDPPYWSKEWWEFTRFSVEEHKRLGLTHFFSNWTLMQFQQNILREERKHKPTFWGRALVLHQRETTGFLELGEDEELLEAAAYRKNGSSIDYASRQLLSDSARHGRLHWKSPGPDWVVTVLVTKRWDLDYLNRAVGQRFGEVFLGEYEKHLPEFVGNTLESFGADEMVMLAGQVLFSPALLSRVQESRGYDVAPYLVSLFYDIGTKTDQVRCDYYDAMTAVLEENFFRPPSAWLESRGMKHSTLSQLGADDPLMQVYQYGDFFRYLRTFHITGNEDPGKQKPGHRRLFGSKMSSSVAHLYERERSVVLECYQSGWGQTQNENVVATNEAYAKGLNFYCRHGNVYSLMGGWYEWVPPEDHFYQPNWRYWGTFTQYVTRLSYILSQGKHRADVALLYPITTIHANWVAGRAPFELTEKELNEVPSGTFGPAAVTASDGLQKVANAIYNDGIDFDFVDNESLERATVRGKVLEVAGVEFRSVVLPNFTTIRLASMRKIREFYDAGGTIVFLGEVPTASAENGRDDPHLRAIAAAVVGRTGTDGHAFLERSNARGGHSHVVKDASDVPSILSRSIVRDVVAPEMELFHLHKKIGDMDVYYLFNVREEARDLPVQFRAQGNPEIWSPSSGETRPAWYYKHRDETTEVRVKIGPNEGVLVVFSPGPAAPAVLDSDLDEVMQVEVDEAQKRLSLEGFDARGGRRQAQVLYRGQRYAAQATIVPPPPKVVLDAPFSFRLEPTMNNRWGDFRYPPSDVNIGAEARKFRYMEEEGDAGGTGRGWHRADFDDTQWPEVTYSYGPYWWHLGPVAADFEARQLLEQILRGTFEPQTWSSGHPKSARWERYSFSKEFGPERLPPKSGGILTGVPENFLLLDRPPPGNDTYYFFTTLQAPEEIDCHFQLGVSPAKSLYTTPTARTPTPLPTRTRAWVNGADVRLDLGPEKPESRVTVHLRKGANTVLVEIVRPEYQVHREQTKTEAAIALYAGFFTSGPPKEERYVPLLRWFREPNQLVYDVAPGIAKPVGWYRFKAPPGVRSIRVPVRARAILGWVDGASVPFDAGKISLPSARRRTSQVALRVEQESGAYGGAAFPEPVMFECDSGEMPLGDWSPHGLETYSGIGVYSQEVYLTKAHVQSKVILDLGDVRSVAEVIVNGRIAGVTLARPFRFDISQFVFEGRNKLEIKVANTLANHMTSYPTKFILPGQTVSGLLGPVEIQFYSPVAMVAKPS